MIVGILFFALAILIIASLAIHSHIVSSNQIRNYARYIENKQNGKDRELIFVNPDEDELNEQDDEEDEIQAIGAENEEEAEEMLFW